MAGERSSRPGGNVLDVLLVDDDAADRVWTARALGAAGGEVRVALTSAGTLAEAAGLLDGGRFDGVLLDLNLPDASGLEALTGLRKQYPTAPLVIVTGLEDEEVARSAVRQGADGYLVKGQMDGRLIVRALLAAIERRALHSELEEHIRELEAARESLRTLVAENADGMVVIDQQGAIRFANPAAEALLGRTADSLVNTPFGLPLTTGKATQIDLIGRDALPRVVEMRAADIMWEGALARLASLRDVTERRREMAALEQQALREPLTGLYNRRAFETIAEQQIAVARRAGVPLVLFFMDLDKMKQVNDQYGHRAGDQALILTARALVETFREADLLCRWGGDEFVALAHDCPGVAAETVVSRLQENVRARAAHFEWPCTLSITVGTTTWDPSSSVSLLDLVRQADEAMYQRKQHRRALRV